MQTTLAFYPSPTQDCNLLQVAIVVLLGGGSGRVTVVGDDDQRCGGLISVLLQAWLQSCCIRMRRTKLSPAQECLCSCI